MVRIRKKIWLSHSGLDILYRCPRCFWLKYRLGISQPEEIVSRLPDRFDRVIKNYFNIFRDTNELPPMIEGKVRGRLEKPFQDVYFYDIDEKYGFYARLDECLVSPEGNYIPIDFKTSSSDPRKNQIFSAYQNQIDEFVFLLEKNNKRTAGFGYLIYFYPAESKELHNGFPMVVHIQKVKAYPEKVEGRFREAIGILEKAIPLPAETCPFCKWYDQLNKVLINQIPSEKTAKVDLDIKENSNMPETISSTKLTAGGKTYFFDVREAQSGDRYLQITESRLKQGGERYRSNIVIFKEYFEEFRQALDEIAEKL